MSEYGERIDKDTIRFRRTLPGPVERVWAWLTEGDKRRRWLAGGETELRTGGTAELVFNNSTLAAEDDQPPEKYAKYTGETRYTGTVVEVEPLKILKFTWPDADGEDSEVAFELEPAGENVILTLTHRRLKDRDDMIGTLAGWHAHMEIMAAKLAAATPPSFWETHTRLEAEYEHQIKEGE